jgi:ribosomal protein L11
MADTKGADVNKSEEIRKLAAAIKEQGDNPRPVVIIAELKKRGIAVSSPQVSIVLKKMGMRPSRGRKPGRKPAAAKQVAPVAAASNAVISVDDLLAAKKVAAQMGGTERALAALAALKRIES